VCCTHWSYLSWNFFLKFFANGYPSFFWSRDLFSSSFTNGFPYIFFAQELFFSSSLQIGTHVFFSQDLCEITSLKSNSWTIQYVQSSIKPTQVWSFINNFSLQTNPLSTNPTNSNQLSLKLWLEINHALKASWKYLSNHVRWCCVKLYFYVLFIFYGGLLARYNENESTNNVKVMSHVDMLLWTMDHPPPTKMYAQYWPCRMVHSMMWYISYMLRSMTSWWLTFFLHICFSIYFPSNHNSNNNSNALQQWWI